MILFLSSSSPLPQDSILSYMDELISVDEARRGFYLDFRSKYLMENEVDKLAVREEIPRRLEAESTPEFLPVESGVHLAARGLTSIHYAVYLTGRCEMTVGLISPLPTSLAVFWVL